MLKDKKPYKHLKTGNIYYSLGTCINCTNKDDGKEMMIYTNEKQIFVDSKFILRESVAKKHP